MTRAKSFKRAALPGIVSRRARRAPARIVAQRSQGTRALAAQRPQMTEEEAVESMASTWRSLTVAWAAELTRLDRHDAAAKVLATRFCTSFREQLLNERAVRVWMPAAGAVWLRSLALHVPLEAERVALREGLEWSLHLALACERLRGLS